MPVTIREVARDLNLSHTTVSRVLNNRDARSIPPSTQERVRTAAQRMGYSPNRSARALTTGRTHLIALQIARLDSPFTSMVSQELQDLVAAEEYDVLAREFGRGDVNLQSLVDGILALDTIPMSQGEGVRSNMPCVLMGSRSSHLQMSGMDYVILDLKSAAHQATHYLIAQGRRHITHVTSQDWTVPGDTRCDGYRSAMEEAGLTPEFLHVLDDRRAAGYSTMTRCLETGRIPDALLCRNDELASGCLRALYEKGYVVPKDTAVIGCDGIEDSEYTLPALSTIVLPTAEMCRIAWQFLRQRIEEPQLPPQSAILEASLLLRASA